MHAARTLLHHAHDAPPPPPPPHPHPHASLFLVGARSHGAPAVNLEVHQIHWQRTVAVLQGQALQLLLPVQVHDPGAIHSASIVLCCTCCAELNHMHCWPSICICTCTNLLQQQGPVYAAVQPASQLPPCPLQGAMAQCRMALKPDGLFLAAMFGGETLQVGG
jgi:hypothetical protein